LAFWFKEKGSFQEFILKNFHFNIGEPGFPEGIGIPWQLAKNLVGNFLGWWVYWKPLVKSLGKVVIVI